MATEDPVCWCEGGREGGSTKQMAYLGADGSIYV